MARKPDYIVFTDGSTLFKHQGVPMASGYGVVVYNCSTREFTQFGGELGDRTIGFAELYAIDRAVRFMINLANGQKRNVLVLSDSKYSVDIYRGLYWSYRKRSVNGIWRTSMRSIVANQRLIKGTVNSIESHRNVRFDFVHIYAHLTEDQCWKIISKLSDCNYSIDKETALAIISMNDKVDSEARKHSRACRKSFGQFIQLRPRERYFIR